MSAQPESLAAIAVPPPRLPVEAVADAVARQFGLTGDYLPLVSERDQNFRLVDATGRAYVVKIVSSADSEETTDFQIEALMHLEARGVSGVPRVIRTMDGGSRGSIAKENDDPLMLRVVSWIDGEVRRDNDATEASSASLGRKAAELDRAFADFSHAGENQVLLWDTQRAAELRGLIGHIDDAEIRAKRRTARWTSLNRELYRSSRRSRHRSFTTTSMVKMSSTTMHARYAASSTSGTCCVHRE